MPIYDFQCSSCGHKAEVMRKISAANLDTCPACQQETFSKQLSAPSFQLNGTGWYATDFKNGNQPAKAAKTDAAAPVSTAPASTESKPAAACATGCACH